MGLTNSIVLFVAIVAVAILAYEHLPQISDYLDSQKITELQGSLLTQGASDTTITPQSQSSTPTDELIAKCTKSFNECVDIATTKYDGFHVSILKIEKFSDSTNASEFDEANEFYNTWKGPNQFGLSIVVDNVIAANHDEILPIVLFATKIQGSNGQLPYVAVCGKNGELKSIVKTQMLCG